MTIRPLSSPCRNRVSTGRPAPSSLPRPATPCLLALFLALALGLAPAAAAREYVLGPAGAPPRLAAGVAWEQTPSKAGERIFASPAHPLRPRLLTDSAILLEVEIPGVGPVQMVPLGIGSGDRALPEGRPRTAGGEEGPSLHVEVHDVWRGVDEVFSLREAGVKHDLVVHEEAIRLLGAGDLRASWALRLPEGVEVRLEGEAGAVLRDAIGTFLARVPQPVVGDGRDHFPRAGIAALEMEERGGLTVLTMVVPAAWLHAPERVYPLRLDPTLTLRPATPSRTGYVDEYGRGQNWIVSGSIVAAGGGQEARGFAEFDTGSIPDTSQVLSVRLQVWMSNHDNPARQPIEPIVQPLPFEIHRTLTNTSATDAALYAAIGPLGGGVTYVADILVQTGDEFCGESFAFREYDLGSLAVQDLQTQLPADYFTLGFVSGIRDDPGFDHIDYMGYGESIPNHGQNCITFDVPGSRITLLVEVNLAPDCDAGGPYTGDCYADPVLLDGSGSSDPDGGVLTYAWTTTCDGAIVNPDRARATLNLNEACAHSCRVDLTVSDASIPSSCSAAVEVADLQPPTLAAPDDKTVECPAPDTGPDSEEGWLASASATDTCFDARVETTEIERTPGCGNTYEVTWEFVGLDECDNRSGLEMRTYTVEDTTPPEILDNLLADGPCLWPPRHDFVCLDDPADWVTAEDLCGSVELTFAGCVSDQPDEAPEPGRPENGDGHFPDDCRLSADGRSVCARVERAGTDPGGRHYSITVLAVDECGNATPADGSLFVPHDRRSGSGGKDDPCMRGDKDKGR